MISFLSRCVLPALLASLFAVAQPALAAPGHHGTPQFSDTLPFWLNFIIFFSILFFLTRKAIAKAWKARRENILHAVTAGERRLQDADAALRALEKREQALGDDVSSIQSRIAEDARNESARLLQEAQTRTEEIKKHAEKAASVERLTEENAVRDELAAHVLAEVEQRVAGVVSEAIDRELRGVAAQGISSVVSRVQ